MACPHGGLKLGCGIVCDYLTWIESGFNPPHEANYWFIDGKSTLIIQNNQLNPHQPTIKATNIPQILELLSGLRLQDTNFNSLRLGYDNPVIYKGNAVLWSDKYDGFKKVTYTIVYCVMPNPDTTSKYKRFAIQTHIIRFHSAVSIPVLSVGNPRRVSDEDIAKAIESGGGGDDGFDLNGVGLSMVQQYYECLVESANVAAREFYWEKSRMITGGPKPEETIITAENAPEIRHLLSFMNITQVTVIGLCCIHEPITNTLLVDVSGIFKYHGDLRHFSELLCISPLLIPSPLDVKLKQYYDIDPTIYDPDHDVGGRRYRFACSIIDFVDPPHFKQYWYSLNRVPPTVEKIEDDSATPEEHSKVEVAHEPKQWNRKSKRLGRFSVQTLRQCFQRLN